MKVEAFGHLGKSLAKKSKKWKIILDTDFKKELIKTCHSKHEELDEIYDEKIFP